jgi:putative SOS response-associated peptidase YedK
MSGFGRWTESDLSAPSVTLMTMCGRYALTASDGELSGLYGASVVGVESSPSWNVAPTQEVRVVLEHRPGGGPDPVLERQIRSVTWGLVPSWSKEPKPGRLINARAETVTEKPSFRAAAARRRCVLPADGYYEWQATPGGKQPYFLHLDGTVLNMAGLYELWRDPAKDNDDPTRWLWTATVLTTTATDAAGQIHDRSPLVLPDSMLGAWLDPRLTDPGAVRELIGSVPPPVLDPYRVGRAVNNVRNNGPELLTPVHA